MPSPLLEGFPTTAPRAPSRPQKYADVAVTATAPEFTGIYRNKQQHAPDFPQVLARALASNVSRILLTGMQPSDYPTNLALAKAHASQCRLTVGIHPYHAGEADAGGAAYFAVLERAVDDAAATGTLGAFGELGLDYDYLERGTREEQKRVFARQLEMVVARGWKVPLFLHCRAAFDDFVGVLRPFWGRLVVRRGLVHSFVGTRAQMEVLVGMGLQVSVNGFCFREREALEMVRATPLASLQVETDAPWGEIQASSEVAKAYLENLAKLPWAARKRDKFVEGQMVKERNESCRIEGVAMVVAGLKGVSVEEVAAAAWENSVDMFWGGE